MPNWEYKVISSGTLGFASLQLLEQHLNQLGKEEWEIIHFQTRPDNPLAFLGLARRPVMRDWVVEAAPPGNAPGLKSGAVPAPPEEKSIDAPSADELRAEAEERRESLLAREESLRPVRAAEEEETDEAEESGDFGDDEDLPTFFEAIRPHMRRNQRGPGMAVGVEYLARKFEQTDDDLLEALKECGFTIPKSARDAPAYLECEGDLYWLNINQRGQLWINTREKPRRHFRPVPGQKVAAEEIAPTGPSAERPDESAAHAEVHSTEKENAMPAQESPGLADTPGPVADKMGTPPLSADPALLDRLRPAMRRNRRGAGLSGSVTYLARALRTEPGALVAAFGALGLVLPPDVNGKPVFVELGEFVYWLNQDKSGQIWINARHQREERGEPVPAQPAASPTTGADAELPFVTPAAVEGAPAEVIAEPAPGVSSLAAVRLLLKETRRGGVAAEVGRIAGELGKSSDELLAALVSAGLQVPEKAREKPVFAEHAGEIFWLNRNARGELWLNAKASKFTEKPVGAENTAEQPSENERATEKKPRRSRKK